MASLGFGFLRLPYIEKETDYTALNSMVDCFLAGGGRYFDTSHTYLDGKSEEAIRECLVKRHPRSSFLLATKVPGYYVKSRDDFMRYFEESRQRCGVDFFDVYMLHWLNAAHYAIAQQQNEFDYLQELKQAGRVKKIGFSFHDTADVLDTILMQHPEVDCVLLQINYLDWESAGIQSRLCYETALRHGKEVLVMEPVKGGKLVSVPEKAAKILHRIDPDASPAALAIRFVKSLPGVQVVLSGMNSMEQLEENLREHAPLTAEDLSALQEAAAIIQSATAIPCTACGYCVKHCPMGIPIPGCFSLYNDYAVYPRHLWKLMPAYEHLTAGQSKASACIGCRTCEDNCPQNLPISQHMKEIAEVFEE